MSRLFCTLLLVLVTVALNAAWSAEDHAVTFYIQVIRGTDQEKPQDASWKAIGPKLSKALSPVFAWKHYWEVKRQEVAVTKGKVTKGKVTPDRDLEIELVKDGQAELRLYRKGELRSSLCWLASIAIFDTSAKCAILKNGQAVASPGKLSAKSSEQDLAV